MELQKKANFVLVGELAALVGKKVESVAVEFET
jgi:hypothetical protein